MTAASVGDDRRDVLTERLGVEVSPEIFTLALTHRSYAYENGGLPTNERLEFLGDSVLGLVVTETLYRLHPDLPEGRLAKLRAAVVNMRALADVARELDLGEFILLGRGEETTGGRDKASILADTVEALIGAVFLDRGLDAADALVHRLFDATIRQAATLGAGLDWKTSLQELTAAAGLGVPEYAVAESGPDHAKEFVATALVNGQAFGSGVGRNKKEAEQRSAAHAYRAVRARLDAEAEAADPDDVVASTVLSGTHDTGDTGVETGTGAGIDTDTDTDTDTGTGTGDTKTDDA